MDDSGRRYLSEAELDLAKAWVDKHWSRDDCPFHGPTNWELDVILGEIDSFRPHRLGGSTTVFPLVILTCDVCGYTVGLNAIKMGIVVKPDPPESSVRPPSESPT